MPVYYVVVDDDDAAALRQLVGGGAPVGAVDVAALLELLARAAADGVRRPGSWERGWITQATGYGT